ncbi:YbgC/FadM family acyl-CoA thioesterase [Rhizorhapis suberifaciens]|uniref:Acyl-CoA thioester hydrolase n=1 Tax=Rhizorhapis suberifaciens TaxID=13656 RepID=A0A840HTJ2_9SPHN|nr:YbgC/FadM family acyl-CoA thioesterase [Rhizorhapis suberifaciens]MBB4640878.1 acyl-CoA thioester hydrolase [Rhizorhapis suberifaciens]
MIAPAPLKPATGRFREGVHEFPVHVYFEDTDLSGMIYHANYLRYMERARSDMLRLVGIDQRQGHENGNGVYALSDLSINYKRPAKLDDDLLVVSKVVEIRAASCRIHQTVICNDQILTDGEVTAAYLSPGGRPQRQPKAWIDIFTRLQNGEDISL